MKILNTFTTLSEIKANTIVERKRDLEIVGQYDAKSIVEFTDMDGFRYGEIVLKNEAGTATFNLEDYQIRTLMYCCIG